jgi:hypothetical protein
MAIIKFWVNLVEYVIIWEAIPHLKHGIRLFREELVDSLTEYDIGNHESTC